MRWRGRTRSTNVVDRRGLGKLGGGLGLGGLLIGVVLVLLGADPLQVLGFLSGGGQRVAFQGEVQDDTDLDDFAAVILADTEAVWGELYPRAYGAPYQEPQLVLFEGRVRSGCGVQSSAVGPFYCPADQALYLDLEFFDQLAGQLDAPGDFARAYVIAHEVGHHVQTLNGTSRAVSAEQRRSSRVDGNRLSVRLELQADYFAGVWAHHAQRRFGYLEPGDLEEALNAAHQIGDDMLQRRSGGSIRPDLFTHGTAEQRARWFRLGFEGGDPRAHDPLRVPAGGL